MSAYIGNRVSPEDADQLRCGLVSTLPEQAGQRCERDATLHLLVRHPDQDSLHQLLTCADHYLTAVQAGELIVDHPVGVACGVDGAIFNIDANECVLEQS